MHVLVNPNISVEKSHILTHEIEDKIKEKLKMNVQVIVHIEPYYNKNN
jgi:divalent metal cation (Fe/Co/Zn/Cd) transporter